MTHADMTTDVLVIGAGIAGASVAYWLAPHVRVTVLERESQPGYHTTGRSAAMYLEAYGSPQVRALTLGSRSFFLAPPEGFASAPLMTRRGALMVAAPGQEAELDVHCQVLAAAGCRYQRLSAEEVLTLVPALQSAAVVGGVLEPDACDLDVHSIHLGFLKGAKHHQAQVVCNAEVTAMARTDSGWKVSTTAGVWQAGVVVNAAGAWVEQVGAMAGAAPIGLTPYRRSAFTFAAPDSVVADKPVAQWPMVYSAAEEWYIKPDAGVLLGSPANADATYPHDVQPEELDIALGIHRLSEVFGFSIRRPLHTWAGLRSFVSDKSLVGGYDPQVPGFFWLAGQGGYGIQTCAAMGETCAALVRRQPLPAHLQSLGLTHAMLSVERLRCFAGV